LSQSSVSAIAQFAAQILFGLAQRLPQPITHLRLGAQRLYLFEQLRQSFLVQQNLQVSLTDVAEGLPDRAAAQQLGLNRATAELCQS